MRLIKWLDKNLEESILVILLINMILIMGLQITMRYIFQSSLTWSEELVRFMFIWSTFISVPYCIKHGRSIKIVTFRENFSKRVKRLLLIVDKIFLLVLFSILTYYAVDVVRMTGLSGQSSTALGLPMGVVQISTVIGFGLSCFRIIQKLFISLKGKETEV